jgi:hypothetical protein
MTKIAGSTPAKRKETRQMNENNEITVIEELENKVAPYGGVEFFE